MSACSFAAARSILLGRCSRGLDLVHLRAEGVHDRLARKDGIGRRSGALILAQRRRSGEACGQQHGGRQHRLPRPRRSVVRSRHFTLPPAAPHRPLIPEPIPVGMIQINVIEAAVIFATRSDAGRYCRRADIVSVPQHNSRHKHPVIVVMRRDPWSPRVRQPVTSMGDRKSHIEVWSHTPRARIPVPPQRADGFDLEARSY